MICIYYANFHRFYSLFNFDLHYVLFVLLDINSDYVIYYLLFGSPGRPLRPELSPAIQARMLRKSYIYGVGVIHIF